MRRLGRREGLYSLIIPGIFYAMLALSIWYTMWPYFYYIKDETFIVLGLFALWRYGWQTINYVRSFIYTWFQYPYLKKCVNQLSEEQKFPEHIFFIIPSYKEEPWVTLEAFQSILSNLAEIPTKATLIVSTGSDQDDKAVSAAYHAHPARMKVELVLQRQNQGKRVAMGHALRAVARRYDGEPDSVCIFMDGDSYLPASTLNDSLPFFKRFKDLGATTTNEAAYIDTKSIWYKEWFNLKFGQRHILFKSHSLSNKVLTLTGRFSMFRTSIITEESFIKSIENDQITHWMHGKFRFLMGDDKSSWFYLLKNGWNMLYLHDVAVYSLESRDGPFLQVSLSLPYRWYGNTLRNNNRALAVGWRKTGIFIWLAILDQRLTMWTSLVGITGAIILSLSKSFIYLPFYLGWVVLVRVIQMSIIAYRGHPVSMLTIPLMLYNQWVGSIIKIKASFNLADQSWSKGGTVQGGNKNHKPIRHKLATFMPVYSMVMAYFLFFYALLLAEGVWTLPKWPHAHAATKTAPIYARQYGIYADDQIDDSAALNRLLENLAYLGPVSIHLPKGQLDINQPLMVKGNRIELVGHPKGTKLLAKFKGKNQSILNVTGTKTKVPLKLASDIQAGDIRAVFENDHRLQTSQTYLVSLPNDQALFKKMGDPIWQKPYPHLRQDILTVKKTGDQFIEWDRAPDFDISAEHAVWHQLKPVTGFSLKNLKIEYQIPGQSIHDTNGRYENLFPEQAVDGLALKYVDQCHIENIEIINAGRHPINLDTTQNCLFERITVNGAWNKGKQGAGYVRIARSHYNTFNQLSIQNIRHLTIQWSSHHNHIHRLESNVDINFHGGLSHHNHIQHARIELPEYHKWPAVFRTDPGAQWAPPDGILNTVENCQWKLQTETPENWKDCE